MKLFLSYATGALQTAVVFSAYFFFAYVALALRPSEELPIFFFPAAGIGLAAVFFLGIRAIPAIVAATFLAFYITNASLAATIIFSLAAGLQPLVADRILKNAAFDPMLRHMKDALLFIATALVSACVATLSAVAVLFLVQLLDYAEVPRTIAFYWIGNALGLLIIGPFIIRWFYRPIQYNERTILDFVEALIFFCVLALITVFVFLEPLGTLNNAPFLYLIFVPLTWGALRVGPRALTLAVCMVTTIAAIGTLQGLGPFGAIESSDLLFLQVFLGAMSSIALVFVTAVEERKDAMNATRRYVEELKEDVQDLAQADKEKNEFIAILSHELRNPLAPVLSSLELMRLKDVRLEQRTELVDTAHAQVQRMARLLDDLLDITRVSRKNFNLKLDHVELRTILEHSVAAVQSLYRQRNHTLEVEYPEVPLWLSADPVRLEQVFVNLLNNAAKYTNPGGRVQIQTTYTETSVQITVADNGIGIPPHMLGIIFEPFRQVNPSNDAGGGLGIGLSLTKRLIEAHKGTITAQSSGEGSGSTFVVTLPLLKVAPVQPKFSSEGAHVQPIAPVRRKKRIIFIDASPDARGFAHLLTQLGHDALAIPHLHVLANHVQESAPDIVMYTCERAEDLEAALATIRRDTKGNAMVVALIDSENDTHVHEVHKAGFDALLVRPISVSGFERILDNLRT